MTADHVLDGDPYSLGFIGYTQAQADAMLASRDWRPPPDSPLEAMACALRLGLLRIGKCDLCGIRGQPFEIFCCKLHGECSLSRKHSGIRPCISCGDRVPACPE